MLWRWCRTVFSDRQREFPSLVPCSFSHPPLMATRKEQQATTFPTWNCLLRLCQWELKTKWKLCCILHAVSQCFSCVNLSLLEKSDKSFELLLPFLCPNNPFSWREKYFLPFLEPLWRNIPVLWCSAAAGSVFAKVCCVSVLQKVPSPESCQAKER